jgi:uncharacterized RmlC-like cupin family protein
VSLVAGAEARTCRVVRRGTEDAGDYGASYVFGIAAETVGARALSMALATVPPGARTRAHVHEHHESAIYVLSGEGALYFGDQLEQCELVGAGDFLYMPEGVPHVAVNTSSSEPLVVLGARTDPYIQEVVLPRPELDERVP